MFIVAFSQYFPH